MKIAYIDETSFTSRHGGAANWTWEIANCMEHRGIQTDIYSYERIFSSKKFKNLILFPYFREIFIYPFLGRKILRKIETSYDLIHFASSTTCAFTEIEVPSVVSTNCLFSRQILDFSPFMPKHYQIVFNGISFNILRYFEKKSYKHASAVVATRKDVKHFVEHQFGIPRKKIQLIPHGLNERMIPRKVNYARNSNVLFVGRATVGKGFHTLLKAADDINGRLICVVSRVSNSFRKEIESKKNIQIETNICKKKIQYFYKTAGLFVMPSLSETGPIATLEAMAHGLPVVGTPQGCGDYVEDGKHGFVVLPEDAVDLARKVNYLLAHHNTARQFGENAREKVLSKYRMSIVGSQIKLLYEELIKNA